jgi:hypothetical protein
VKSGGEVAFVKGQAYTREQIHDVLGGSRREALPTRGGNVVCGCLTRRMNPRAPDEIVIGGKDRAIKRARALAASGVALPVFVRARRGGWEFAGRRRVRSMVEEPGALLSLVVEGAPADATLVLLLEEASEQPTGAIEAPVGALAAGPGT